MKPAVLVIALGVVAACCAGAAEAGGNANFVLGARGLDEDFWSPDEDQGVLGVTVDFGRRGWPIHLAAGTAASGAEEHVSGGGKFSVGIGELSFGVLKVWEPQGWTLRPYVGGGLAIVSASAELKDGSRVEDDDTSAGVYAQGGVFWRIGPKFNIGLDLRVMGGTDITLFGASGDADYGQAGLVLGWGWP